jgi:hypothetical protein
VLHLSSPSAASFRCVLLPAAAGHPNRRDCPLPLLSLRQHGPRMERTVLASGRPGASTDTGTNIIALSLFIRRCYFLRSQTYLTLTKYVK